MAFSEFNYISIKGVAAAVPRTTVIIDSLMPVFGTETINSLKLRTGIKSFRKSDKLQTTSDLGYKAAIELIDQQGIDKDLLCFVIFISKTPDYRSPATATVLHKRLGLSQDCIAFDINLGGAGFVYGLQIGCSLLENTNKNLGVLVIGDTPSKQFGSSDPDSIIFGDCSSAIILEKKSGVEPIYVQTGSDGDKLKSFFIRGGGFRILNNKTDKKRNEKIQGTSDNLVIDWPEYISFAVSGMNDMINDFLGKCQMSIGEYDFLAFAREIEKNLDVLREEIMINSKNNNVISLFGDVCGSLVPLLLVENFGNIGNVDLHILAAGYGEGLSFGLADFFVNTQAILPLIETDAIYEDGNVSRYF